MGTRPARFVSLRTRNYRLYFCGQTVSVAGTWMQNVALAWYVLELRGGGAVLGAVTAARYFPQLLIGPVGGLWADRLDKRRTLLVTQSLQGLLAAVLAIAVGLHHGSLALVFAIALLLGVVSCLDTPTRQTLIPLLVPREQLSDAVVLNSITVNAARVVGPAVSGVLIGTVGVSACFGANAASFLAVLASLALMRPGEIRHVVPEIRAPRQVREGWQYVRANRTILLPLAMIAIVGTMAWEFQVTLPLVASRTFHAGASGYGLMFACLGAGAVAGGVLTQSFAPRARSVAWAAVLWGVAELGAAVAPDLGLELAALAVVGFGTIWFNAMSKTVLQLATVPRMQGRVMALWTIAWAGSTPIGGPLVGWIGQSAGPRWSLVAGALPALAVGSIALMAMGDPRPLEEPATPPARCAPPATTAATTAAAAAAGEAEGPE